MLRLASGSPRRVELLGLLGVDFERHAPTIDESAFERPALAKARAVERRGDVTLAADTLVLLEDQTLGKPADDDEAAQMLHRLAGRWHVVRTEVVVIGASGRELSFTVRSRVLPRAADEDAIAAYVATKEPLGKAGAYNIAGAGAALVEAYEGCYANIMGLPLCHAYFALRRAGVVTQRLPEPAFAEHSGFTCPAWRCAYAQGRALRGGAEYDSWTERVS